MRIGLRRSLSIPSKHAADCVARLSVLSNMGHQAITSHLKSVKHTRIVEGQKSTSVAELFGKLNEREKSAKNEEPTPSTSKITDFVFKEELPSVEIIWVMKVISSHSSYNGWFMWSLRYTLALFLLGSPTLCCQERLRENIFLDASRCF
ncbi:hypothetical protein AVEN_166613-1 [Araneus ventricosus]|uniref:Uncharacterized protein n=1 Tax=Araneus ventricosus TaxID=182803 RepID=A0A4Y2JHI1_ARAVE|nr:hypothetical protein AVEN_166613-1 [Araneus ventricosus]